MPRLQAKHRVAVVHLGHTSPPPRDPLGGQVHDTAIALQQPHAGLQPRPQLATVQRLTPRAEGGGAAAAVLALGALSPQVFVKDGD
jgi:hypothetical protein